MTTQLLIAPPTSGKTSACIQAIHTLLIKNPTATTWVIVRDRMQADHFRRRLAATGGAINVRVATFRDLSLEILERSDLPLSPQVSTPMQYRLIQAAVERAELSYFSPLRGLPGLARSVQALIAELQRALVSPADLMAQANPAHPGLAELARIYQTYLDLLAATGWMDSDGLAGEALGVLAGSPRLLNDWSFLVVDGFDWFETAQIRLLQAVCGQVRQVLITLPGDPRWARPVHRRFEQSFMALRSAVPVQALPAQESVHLPDALAALEAKLLEPSVPSYGEDTNSIHLLEARSPQEEAREALRWIKTRIVRDHIRPDGCAVLVHDPDAYFPFLRQAATEFGLPLCFTQGRRLVDTPVISALRNLLRLPASSFPRRALLDALRSPFFDFSGLGLQHRQIDVLDLVSRQGKIIEGIDQWAEVFSGLLKTADSNPATEDISEEEENARLPTLPRGAAAQQLWTALQRVFGLLCPPEVGAPAGTWDLLHWVQWLEDTLATLRFYETGQAPENHEIRAALLALREGLQGILAAEVALSHLADQEANRDSRGISYLDFIATVEAVLESTGVGEEQPEGENAILAMRLLETRGLRFDSVAILGLAEGTFPQVERPDPILDEEIRQKLGMNSRLEQGQLGLFYQAITRADGALLLTRPYLTNNGDPWEASPYWNGVQALFPGQIQRVRPEDLRSLTEAASPQEALFWAARQGMSAAQMPQEDDPGLQEQYIQVLHAKSRLEVLLGRGPDARHPAQAEDGLLPLVQARLGAKHTWSVSRLEKYLACPNRFLLESLLELEAHDPPDLDYNPAQLGQLLHAILERAYHRAADPADLQAVLAVLPEVAEQAFAEAPTEYGIRPSQLWDQQQAELLDRLEATIAELGQAEGGWHPLCFEQAFGLFGTPPLLLDIQGQQVKLHGIIDRIDQNAAGELRVIDYKTGSSHQGARDLVEGRRLQLAVYALAARDALGLGNPVEGFYWHIGPKGKSGLQLSTFTHEAFSGTEGALIVAREHIGCALEGVQQARFQQAPLDGKCSPYCVAAPWCWHYEPE